MSENTLINKNGKNIFDNEFPDDATEETIQSFWNEQVIKNLSNNNNLKIILCDTSKKASFDNRKPGLIFYFILKFFIKKK